jgi:double-stranded uracil-DNA glycosylase
MMAKRQLTLNQGPPPRPTRADLEAARSKTIRDVLAPRLDILFVGINPGLYTAAIGHHFGRPGNRFWPSLFASGLVDRRLTPYESDRLFDYRLGITNLVERATAREDELTLEEYVSGEKTVRRKILRYKPRIAAFLGLGLYRTAFGRAHARVGLQVEKIGSTHLWVLPNPSGLNAHYQLKDYARMFRRMRIFLAREE